MTKKNFIETFAETLKKVAVIKEKKILSRLEKLHLLRELEQLTDSDSFLTEIQADASQTISKILKKGSLYYTNQTCFIKTNSETIIIEFDRWGWPDTLIAAS